MPPDALLMIAGFLLLDVGILLALFVLIRPAVHIINDMYRKQTESRIRELEKELKSAREAADAAEDVARNLRAIHQEALQSEKILRARLSEIEAQHFMIIDNLTEVQQDYQNLVLLYTSVVGASPDPISARKFRHIWDELTSLQERLAIINQRISQYVSQVDVDLQLVKDKVGLEDEIRVKMDLLRRFSKEIRDRVLLQQELSND